MANAIHLSYEFVLLLLELADRVVSLNFVALDFLCQPHVFDMVTQLSVVVSKRP